MIVPEFLHSNDPIAIISPSGAIDPLFIEQAQIRLTERGLMPIVGVHAKGKYGRYCGTVEERLFDLRQAFENPEIKAIFCSRGGYGVVQLLEQLPETLFRNHPKWVIGYSDITALHAALQKASVASIHAPMLKHLSQESKNDEASEWLFRILKGELPNYTTATHKLNRLGEAQGVVRGGNLSVLSGLRGTAYDLPHDEEFILFIEDVGEQPYHIERMLINFRLGGIFERVSGLIVGQFANCEEDLSMGRNLYETIAEAVAQYRFPISFNFPIGHVKHNLPMPCGIPARLIVRDDSSMINYNF